MYLHSIALSNIENLVSIDDVVRNDTERKMADALKKEGFRHFIKCESDLVELGRQAITSIAKSNPDAFEKIDSVIYATDSSWENDVHVMSNMNSCLPSQGQRNGLLSVLNDMGMNLIPYGLTFSACDNLGRVMCLASSLLKTKTHKNILVIVGDKTEPGYSRFTLSGSALYSDFVGAFILSNEKPQTHSYQVENISYVSDCSVVKITLEGAMQKMLHTTKMLKRIRKDFEASGPTGKNTLAAYDKIVMGHYNDDFVESACVILDIDTNDVMRQYCHEYAHCYAIDPLIALKRAKDDGKITDGETVLQLTSAAEMATLCGYTFCE